MYNYFYEFASKALHIVIFESFVKSMMFCLSKLKVTPSFCIPFKISDDPTASNCRATGQSALLPVGRPPGQLTMAAVAAAVAMVAAAAARPFMNELSCLSGSQLNFFLPGFFRNLISHINPGIELR